MKHVSVKITDVVKLCITCNNELEQEILLDEEQSKRLGHMLVTLEPGGFDIL